MDRVVIVDYSLIPVGEHWDKDLGDLAFEAAEPLIDKYREIIDALYIGNALGLYCNLQGNLGAYVADVLGFNNIEAFCVNNAEASALSAMYLAIRAILSGEQDVVLVGGVEKITDILNRKIIEGLSLSVYHGLLNKTGISLAGIAALMAREYIKRYNLDRKYISYLSVQDHENAVTVKHAQFRSKITIEKVLNSPLISDPLTIFDISPVSDGSAFVLLMKESLAKEYGLNYVSILGMSMATQTTCIIDREDILDFKATKLAAKKALEEAGLKISDINVFEVNDDFSITGVLSLESLNLFDKGKAAIEIANGKTKRTGIFPVNTFGGLKARGHPIGATGIYQVSEVFMQLMNLAGDNQVNNAKYGLVQNYGGLDSISCVFILGKGEVA